MPLICTLVGSRNTLKNGFWEVLKLFEDLDQRKKTTTIFGISNAWIKKA